DDPTDELSVVAALRSPGFGCGDDDLVRHRLARGGWDYRLDPPPETAGGPVASGLGWLRQVHEKRAWLEVSELVRLVIDDRRLMLLALDDRRWREGWRRLRFVADLARQFTESSPGDHRRFLAWLDVQAGDNAGVTEVVLPEPDLEAVRVMTIHAAKGLEFPVVVVAGLGGGRRPNGREVLFGERGPEIGLRKDLCTDGHPELSEQRAAIEEEERLRLLYVAATRAQDHLVVSVHRGQRAGESLAGRLAAALEQVDEALWVAAEPGGSVPAGSVPGGTLAPRGSPPSHEAEWSGAAPVEGPDERAAWDEARRLLLAEPPRVVAATGVARLVPDRTGPGHHGDTGCDDVDGITGAGDPAGDDPGAGDPAGDDIRPPWRRGRAGTAVGRAVHAVLQAVDLVGGADLEALASAHADAEAIPARVAEVAALARAGLRSETVRAAVGSRRYWRELYVGVPLGSRVLEGFVDLLYEGADGLEVVDYKTDQVAGDADLDGAVRRYRLQGAAYALAVEEAVGAPVERCTFLFLRPDGAVARTVGDLAAAKQEVRVLVEGAGGGPQAPETLDDG
ncbi:MAG: 3'-5' exonuclease, partial [Acidimicrobiales bacterium]